jgi:hypothetical protein
MAQNQQLMQQVGELTQLLQQQSQASRENIVDNALNPTPEQQIEQAQQAQEQITPENIMDRLYENPMGTIGYLVKNAIQGELGDVKGTINQITQDKQAAQEQRDWVNAINTIVLDKDNYPDFEALEDSVSEILNSNPAFKSGDKLEALKNAIDMARGRQPKQPVPDITSQLNDDGFLEKLIQVNPDFLKKIALIQSKNAQGQQVPPLSASSGAVGASLNIYNKPQTFDDAKERTYKMFE